MESIFQEAKALSESVKSNKSYQDYIKAKIFLESKPELFARVKEYKKLEFQNKLSKTQENEASFEMEKYIGKQYNDLLLNNIIKDFFEKERIFLDMFLKICDIISEDLDVESFNM